jgi:hypothetical protein
MPVILYYEDPAELFEVSGILIEQPEPQRPRWHAKADWETKRQIRG